MTSMLGRKFDLFMRRDLSMSASVEGMPCGGGAGRMPPSDRPLMTRFLTIRGPWAPDPRPAALSTVAGMWFAVLWAAMIRDRDRNSINGPVQFH
jgi:hypothetical protein